MSYEVLIIIVVINALATLSMWRKLASKSSRGPTLNKKAATALWRSDPIVPKHDPPRIVGGKFSSLADEEDRRFFADFKDFADVVNWWLSDEHTASQFRLQDLPDGDVRLHPGSHSGPILGRCFAIYHNQTRVGRLEVSPEHKYSNAVPDVYTDVEVDWARFFGYDELTELLQVIAWHVTTGNPKSNDYRDALSSINAGLTKTLWDNYRVSYFDKVVDRTDEWGELSVSFHGTASCYILRRDAPARPRSR